MAARSSYLILILALGLCAPPTGLADTEPVATFESPSSTTAAVILPAELRKGEHFEVEEMVATRYFMHEFVMKSDYGTHTLLSRRMLEIRARETETMAGFIHMKGGPEFLKSLGSSLAALPTAAVQIVLHPVDSARKIGSGLSKTGKRIGDLFRRRPRTVYEDSAGANAFNGSEKRKLAATLGLDPYSTNPQLQHFLDRVANWRSAGSLTVDVASFALPVVGFVAITTARWRADVQQLLCDKSPAELERYNANVFMDLGVPRTTWWPFLSHPWLSPRHETVITATAKEMKDVAGLGYLLDAARSSQSEVGALMQEQQAILLAYHHTDVDKLTSLVPASYLVAARTASGNQIAFLPVDTVAWTAEARTLIEALAAAMPTAAGGARTLYVTGTVSPRARKELLARGLNVVAPYQPGSAERAGETDAP